MIKVVLMNDVDRISTITTKDKTLAAVLEENGFPTVGKSYAVNAETIRDLNRTFESIDDTVDEYRVVAVSKKDNA